jgi:hypothetical protein
MTTRRGITPTLAPLVQLLELEQPRVVSSSDLADYATQVGLHRPVPLIVRNLRERGWLLDLTTHGVWEFAPAARAGAFGAGDPFVELRATLKRDPAAPFAVAAESAAYELGLSSRRPDRDVVGAPAGARLPKALDAFRSVAWSPSVPLAVRDGLPTWSVDTLLAFMASKPSGYRDWPNVGEWIAQAAGGASVEALEAELAGLPRSAWARAAYLLEEGGQPDHAADLLEHAPAGRGPYYLGVRETPGRYSATYGVIDSTGLGAEDE